MNLALDSQLDLYFASSLVDALNVTLREYGVLCFISASLLFYLTIYLVHCVLMA